MCPATVSRVVFAFYLFPPLDVFEFGVFHLCPGFLAGGAYVFAYALALSFYAEVGV